MSAARFTPGPWEQHSLMVSEAGQRPGQRRDICHCGIGMRDDPYEAEANAHLIAAAPELLEALRELYEAESAHYPPAEAGQDAQTVWVMRKAAAHDKARAAIAAATGAAS